MNFPDAVMQEGTHDGYKAVPYVHRVMLVAAANTTAY